MRPNYLVLFTGVLFLSITSLCRAERQMEDKSKATDVITGVVKKLTTAESQFGNDGVKTDYTAEVVVSAVEKGKNTQAGKTIQIRWFHVTKRPSGPFAGAFGHGYDVKAKDAIRAFLIRNEGDAPFQVIYNPEGIEKQPHKKQ